jgi:hypothetical protein
MNTPTDELRDYVEWVNAALTLRSMSDAAAGQQLVRTIVSHQERR